MILSFIRVLLFQTFNCQIPISQDKIPVRLGFKLLQTFEQGLQSGKLSEVYDLRVIILVHFLHESGASFNKYGLKLGVLFEFVESLSELKVLMFIENLKILFFGKCFFFRVSCNNIEILVPPTNVK